MLWYTQRSEDNFSSQFSPSTRLVLAVKLIRFSCKCLYSLSLLASPHPPSLSLLLEALAALRPVSSHLGVQLAFGKALMSTFCSFPGGNNLDGFHTALTAKQCRIFCSSWKTNKLPVQHVPPRGKALPWNEGKECFRVGEYADHYPPVSQQHRVWHYCVPGIMNGQRRRERVVTQSRWR